MLEWAGIFGTVGSAQLFVQGLSFLGGIMIVRFLSSQEYALYTLANAMLATMNSLANGGISSGIMAESGKVWRDPVKLGSVIATGFSLRRWFAVGGVVIAGPVLLYLLHGHGATWPMAAILFATVAANFWFCALGSIYNVAPALHQRLSQIQRIAAVQGVARVAGLAVAVAAVPTAIVALVVTAAAQAWASFRLRLATIQIAAVAPTVDPHVRGEVLEVVRRVLPSAVYMALSSQISIWLISICGDTEALAQLGALGRLGQVFAIFSAFAAAVFVPRFARLPQKKSLLRRRFLQTVVLILSMGAVCVGFVALFPAATLWILGAHYRGLTGEVVLQAICSLLWFTSGIAYSLAAARGLAIRPQISIPLQIFAQLGLISLLNLSTVKGLLWMTILVGAWQLAIYVADSMVQMGRLKDGTESHA